MAELHQGLSTQHFMVTRSMLMALLFFKKKTFQIMVGHSKSLSIVLKRHEEFIWNRLR